MNDSPLVSALNGFAHLNKKPNPGGDGELVLVAILRYGHTLDQFHDEIRTARIGRSAVEDAGDVRMVHQRQGLSLRLEARDHRSRVHPELDNLQSDPSFDRFALLGHIDDAHSTLADLRQ